MMMEFLSEQNLDALFLVASYRNYAYIGLLIFVLMLEKKITSFTITLLVLSLGENFSSFFTEALLTTSRNEGMFYTFLWYCVWTLYSFVIIYFIYFFHKVMRIRSGKAALYTAACLLMIALLQVLDFLERSTINYGVLANLYQYGIVYCNLAVLPGILFFWTFEKMAEQHSDFRG